MTPHVGDSVQGNGAQLGHVRLADHDRPRGARAAHDLRVLARGLAVGVRAERAHLAGHVEFVLHRDRHAQQRALAVARAAARVGLVGFHPHALVEHDPEGVQLGIQPLDPLQADVHQLARADLTRGDQLGLTGETGVCEVARVHGPGI